LTDEELKMTDVRPDVRAFFEGYRRAGEDPDSGALMSCFADAFMSLDSSSATVASPQKLLAALPRRRQLFESIGSDGLELADIRELPLDGAHTLVRTSWDVRMRNASADGQLTLHSTFVLRRGGRGWQIVLYLNHQDLPRLFSDLAGHVNAGPGSPSGGRPSC
jgi:hypothetical protein